MRVLLAVDKFKGSLDSVCAAEALSAGIQSVRAHAEVRIIPVADGGDGTVDVALTAGFTRIPTNAPGPTGLQLATSYARKGDSVIIELASVCGLQRLPRGRLEPWKSSTYGLGVLICHAVDHGARTIVVGVGGSASTDGGTGLLQALGARLNDSSNHPVRSGAIGLGDLCAVDLGPVHERLAGVELVIASDVDNPLLGPNGAAAAYGPQKGASWRDVIAMNQLLADWSAAVRSEFSIELSTQPGSGAAGGAGFGLLLAGARMQAGADLLLDIIGYDELLRNTDLVVTGEGSLDVQTLAGKAPARIAARAAAVHVPVVAVVGRCLLDDATLTRAGVRRVYPLSDLEPDTAMSIANAAELLRRTGEAIAADWISQD